MKQKIRGISKAMQIQWKISYQKGLSTVTCIFENVSKQYRRRINETVGWLYDKCRENLNYREGQPAYRVILYRHLGPLYAMHI